MKKILIGLLLLLGTSSFAADTYSCEVVGSFTNMDNKRASVDVKNLNVTVDSTSGTLFGRSQSRWAISIGNVRDGNESPLVLRVRAPNQNAAIGVAYAERGSKYIGFSLNSDLDALCIRK